MSWESSYYAEHDLMADCGRCGDRGLVDECECLQQCECRPTACPDCHLGKEQGEAMNHGADKFYGDGQGGRNAREIALGKWKDRLEAENKELRNQVTLLEAGQEMRDFRIEQLTTRVSLLTGENESLTARALSDASILANYRIFYNEETGECT